jgi:hypothetical protein
VSATITTIARPWALRASAAQPASFLFCHIAHLKKTPLLEMVKTSPRIFMPRRPSGAIEL